MIRRLKHYPETSSNLWEGRRRGAVSIEAARVVEGYSAYETEGRAVDTTAEEALLKPMTAALMRGVFHQGKGKNRERVKMLGSGAGCLKSSLNLDR
jgi:hypothetical protein